MASKELKAVPVNTGTIPRINTSAIPQGPKTSIAQVVFEAIQRDFQRPEIQEDYQRWKSQRAAVKN